MSFAFTIYRSKKKNMPLSSHKIMWKVELGAVGFEQHLDNQSLMTIPVSQQYSKKRITVNCCQQLNLMSLIKLNLT